jgi:hypothetical protein
MWTERYGEKKGMGKMKNEIKFGDEVQLYSEKGEPMLGTRFIVTEISDNYLAGIDFGGEIYQFDTVDQVREKWKKTGRHFDIIGALEKLRDGEIL